MKYLVLPLAVVILLAGCSPYKCYPSKGSRDYGRRQWTTQRSDGYYIVTTIHGFKDPVIFIYECKPDSATLAKL